LAGDFRFEAEAIRLQFDVLQNFAAEDLVTRFHVAELQVGKNVGEQRQEFVAAVMPKIMDALRAAQESRTINHVGTVVKNGFEKRSVILGVVFEIGVLHEYDVSSGRFETAAQGSALAAVLRLGK